MLQTLTFMDQLSLFGNQTPYVEVMALSCRTICSVPYLKLTYMWLLFKLSFISLRY